jgi:RHS repeat-associated protein
LPTDIGFTGQRSDSTGLMYYRARYYAQGLGRFISADTIVPQASDPQSWNRYSYTRNNPINRIDPTGHMDENDDDGGVDIEEIIHKSYDYDNRSEDDRKLIDEYVGAVKDLNRDITQYHYMYRFHSDDTQAVINLQFKVDGALHAVGALKGGLEAGNLKTIGAALEYRIGASLGPMPLSDANDYSGITGGDVPRSLLTQAETLRQGTPTALYRLASAREMEERGLISFSVDVSSLAVYIDDDTGGIFLYEPEEYYIPASYLQQITDVCAGSGYLNTCP